MDILSLLGILLAGFALVGGSILKGSGVTALLGGAAFMIVVVGSFAAIFVQTPLPVFRRAVKILPWVFKPPVQNSGAVMKKIIDWSNTARKEGLLGLEPVLKKEDDEFYRKGLQMLVDGNEPEVMRGVLETELSSREDFDNKAAKVFEGLGIYSPTLGIIGAVMGLMAVMQNLADPSKLGPGLATAFVATIYGIGMANLLFLPMASKLKGIIADQLRTREMAIEGLVAIAHGENPRNIESRLSGFIV